MAWMDSSALLSGSPVFRWPLLPLVFTGSGLRACVAARLAAAIPSARAVSGLGPTAGTTRRGVVRFYSRSRLQPVLAVNHDLIPFGNATRNQRNVTLRQINPHGLQVCVSVLHGIHIATLVSMLNRRQRNNDGILSHVQHQPNIDKLVWPERQVVVVKHRLESNRPRGGVDLVINRH